MKQENFVFKLISFYSFFLNRINSCKFHIIDAVIYIHYYGFGKCLQVHVLRVIFVYLIIIYRQKLRNKVAF